MGCKGVIIGKFVGVVTVCSLVGESKCLLERGKAGGLAASVGFLRACLADPFARLREEWRWVACQTCAEFRAAGRSLCCKRAYVGLIEGVEGFGEVAEQDAERFLVNGTERCPVFGKIRCPIFCTLKDSNPGGYPEAALPSSSFTATLSIPALRLVLSR